MRRSIKIKGQVWKIRKKKNLTDDDGIEVLGLCDYDAKTLWIDSELKGHEAERVFRHELLHACLEELHVIIDDTLNEVIVDGLETILNDLFIIKLK